MSERTKRVCLFTGASGTLGTAFIKAHADKYDIAAVYRKNLPRGVSQRQRFFDPLHPESPLDGDAIYAIQADLNDERQIQRVVDLTLARFDRIDLIVNAAVRSVWGPTISNDTVLDSAEQQFRTNVIVPLKLAVVVAREYWRHRDRENVRMRRNIVNISSTAGLTIHPGSGQVVYSASKAALNYLTCHMADEFHAIGIRVNAIAPNSFPRLVPTERVADAIHHLDESDANGKVLSIDTDGEQLI